MDTIGLLLIGGIPDSNLVEVRSWTTRGVDLMFDGNVTPDALLRDERLEVMTLVLGGSAPARDLSLPRRPDVAFNLICNAESSTRALEMAKGVCDRLADDGVPVLNHPQRVQKTTRIAGAAAFADLSGVHAPAPRRLESPNMQTLREMLDSGEIAYPAIVRTVADHNGENMLRLLGPGDVEGLNRLPVDGRDYYVTPYVDFKNTDGLYRKLRLIKVGGEILPRHLIASEEWKIHSGQRGGDSNASATARANEQAYLRDPSAFLGADLFSQLVVGLERTGLDFVGIDFAVLDDGSAVIFECNACTNAATRSSPRDENTERGAAKRALEDAFFDCVQAAARSQQTNAGGQE